MPYRNYLRSILEWKHQISFRKRKIISETDNFVVTEYNISSSKIFTDTNIIFFSDTHFNKSNLKKQGELLNLINSIQTDVIIFGGDLVSYNVNLPEAIEFLSKINQEVDKIGVLGNWEYRKLGWPGNVDFWVKKFREANFKILCDNHFEKNNIRFYGLNYNLKIASKKNISNSEKFTCLISHIPDTASYYIRYNNLKCIDLILSGHTHGGQIRVPYFNSFIHSLLFGRTFEYGLYKNRQLNTKLIITNGIGNNDTFDLRLFCKPEIVILKIHSI
ncbi:MAG: hypothetical protein GY756_15675 [bacterium]|nr:hypothetical protein [bacterium]